MQVAKQKAMSLRKRKTGKDAMPDIKEVDNMRSATPLDQASGEGNVTRANGVGSNTV